MWPCASQTSSECGLRITMCLWEIFEILYTCTSCCLLVIQSPRMYVNVKYERIQDDECVLGKGLRISITCSVSLCFYATIALAWPQQGEQTAIWVAGMVDHFSFVVCTLLEQKELHLWYIQLTEQPFSGLCDHVWCCIHCKQGRFLWGCFLWWSQWRC